uniref:Putative secreted protein n=1 Tax=Anopheles darlingi TaxID=43151 RepID=A0A2M4DL53_ANODA
MRQMMAMSRKWILMAINWTEILMGMVTAMVTVMEMGKGKGMAMEKARSMGQSMNTTARKKRNLKRKSPKVIFYRYAKSIVSLCNNPRYKFLLSAFLILITTSKN